MTGDAGRVRSFKLTAGVAAIAGDIGMGAIEFEAGAEVVERLLRVGRRACQQ